MVNNIGSLLVAMVARKNLDFIAFDFDWQTLQCTSPISEMMISTKWQLPQTSWNGGVVGVVMDNTPIT
jgi:hypothetical protein